MTLYDLGGVRPDLPRGSFWIAPTAVVIGRVRIGADASIWFNAVLRGDSEIIEVGERSNIQDGCVLHTDPGFPLSIGPGCTIGHRAILHGCTIGENSLIGMGSTLLNGAVIGRNSVVGANSLITEGKTFPDNSLVVGSPAKVVRQLDEAAVEDIRRAAANYVERWRRYAAELVPSPDSAAR